MPVVVQFVPDPLQLLYKWLVDVPYILSLVVAVLRGFVRDGIFLRFDNLGDQESELLCLPNCGTVGSVSSVVLCSSSEVSSCGSRGAGGCDH